MTEHELKTWPVGFEALGLAGMLATSLLLAVGGLFRVRSDPFPAAAGGVVLASLASVVALYDAVGFKALRGAMFGMPLCGVALISSRCRVRAPTALPSL